MERFPARPTRHRHSGNRAKKTRIRVNVGELRARSGPEGRHQKSRAQQSASIPGLPPRGAHTKGVHTRLGLSRRATQIGLAVLGGVMAVVVVALVIGGSTGTASTGPANQPVAAGPPAGAPPETETQDRIAVGQALSRSGRIEAGGPVQDLFTAGRVDPRILSTLAMLIQRGPVQVRDLPAMDDADAPRRQLVLDVPAAEVESVRTFFSAQQGPYHPASVTTTPTGVQIIYPPDAPPELLQGLAGS